VTEPVARSETGRDDEAAWFEAALAAQVPALYGAARRLARNDADAEDLVAEAVSRAWLGRDRLRDRAAFRGWLFRILTNLFLTECRLRESRPPVEPLPDEGAADPSTGFFAVRSATVGGMRRGGGDARSLPRRAGAGRAH
jgi:RNA polymerase sigma-70 factor (ECF subfamily)